MRVCTHSNELCLMPAFNFDLPLHGLDFVLHSD